MEILKIIGLKTYFHSDNGLIKAVDGISLSINKGELVCLLGESGSGKTVTALSILGLIDSLPGIIEGEIYFENTNLLNGLKEYVIKDEDGGNKILFKDIPGWQRQHKKNLKGIRGRQASLIFQDPLSSLHPMYKVRRQITETLLRNKICADKKEANELSLQWLERVKLSDPKRVMELYPFELSGGMAQRVMIAISLCSNPKLLIADEPTTALDTTIQLEILKLLKNLQQEMELTILLITHDVAIASNYSDKIAVMYSGKLVEFGTADQVLKNNISHPYTKTLLNTYPALRNRLPEKNINFISSALGNNEKSCVFLNRCTEVNHGGKCVEENPPVMEIEANHHISCWGRIDNN